MNNRASMGHIYDLFKRKGLQLSYDETNPPPGVSDEDRSPWFIEFLMICGGLIAASFMMGVVGTFISLFLYDADPLFIGMLGIIIGLVAIVGTIMVVTNSDNIGAFQSGLLFPVHIVGQILFIAGLAVVFSEWLSELRDWQDVATLYGIVYLAVGVIYLATTTMTTRKLARIPTFASYLYLISHVIGHGMVLFGVGAILSPIMENWDENTAITTASLIVIALQIPFIALYPNAIYRFLATLVISSALFSIAFVLESAVLISLLIGSLMFVAIVIWSDLLPARWQVYSPIMFHPVAYGAMLSAFVLLIYEVTNRYVPYYDDMLTTETAVITTIILFVGLILLEIVLMKEYKVSVRSPYAIAIYVVTLIVTLPVYATPGILAAIIGIVLAFRRRNRIVLILSNVYLAGFIIYFYYWLEFTLLTKSIVLMTTGVILIAARLLLRRMVIVPDEKKGSIA